MNDDPQRVQLGRESHLRLGLIAAALVAGGFVLWLFSGFLLIVFAAILLAIALRSLTRLLQHRVGLGERTSLAAVVVLIGAGLAGFVVLLGAQIQAQAADLIEQIPEMWRDVEQRFGLAGVEDWLLQEAEAFAEHTGFLTSVAGYTSLVALGLAHALLVLAGGVYLAYQPDVYRKGLLLLFPRTIRPKVAETLDHVGDALELWLLGQLLAMVLVGTLTGLGLWLLGVPSAFALGLLAGIAEFVPMIGPILAAIPAIVVALSESAMMALWVLVLYIVVQQVESNLITPIVQRHTVRLPQALTLFAVVASGLLFGVLGLLLAAPLTVFAYVLVKKLWVREALKEDVSMPGEPDPD